MGLEKIILFDVATEQGKINASNADDESAGVCSVYAHGAEGAITPTTNLSDAFTIEQVATAIAQNCPSNQEVQLYSCYGGSGGNELIGQNLANATGRTVHGYNGLVRYKVRDAFPFSMGVTPLSPWPITRNIKFTPQN